MQSSKRNTDVKNRLLDSEKARVARYERIALKRVCYHKKKVYITICKKENSLY